MATFRIASGGKERVSIKRGDTHSSIVFDLVSVGEGTPMIGADDTIYALIGKNPKEKNIIDIPCTARIGNKVALVFTKEAHEVLKAGTYSLEIAVHYHDDRGIGIYPSYGYIELEILDSMLSNDSPLK